MPPQGPKPTASAGCSAAASPGRPIQRALDRPAAQQGGGGVPAAGRRPHCVGPPHTPAPLSPIGWTIKGGQNRMDIDGQGEGWTKCSGWPHRRVRRLTGFSTTWVGCGRRIGSGRAVGVRGGTLRGPGIWRSRRLVGGTSGWRGTCRRLRLGTVAPPKKMILLRLRRFGDRCGVGTDRPGGRGERHGPVALRDPSRAGSGASAARGIAPGGARDAGAVQAGGEAAARGRRRRGLGEDTCDAVDEWIDREGMLDGLTDPGAANRWKAAGPDGEDGP